TTVEGIGGADLHAVQRAFIALDALQCGFCTPGFIVEAKAFYDVWRAEKGAAAPTREEIGAAFSGHLCRCGAYENIVRAVVEACAGVYDRPGAEPPRIEARDKVTGKARYTFDLSHEGQLDASQLVGFVGEPVAAVAAVDRATAERALAAIGVQYEALAAVVGPDAAQRADAPVAFPRGKGIKYSAGEGGGAPASWRGNLRGPVSAFSLRAGAARKTIAAARLAGDPLLVEGVFRTSAQQHNALEPHNAIARFEGEDLIVEISTQAVSALAHEIAAHFKLAPARVRVVAEHIGGGFGSKASLGMETIAAVTLAKAAHAPVRVAYARHEELS